MFECVCKKFKHKNKSHSNNHSSQKQRNCEKFIKMGISTKSINENNNSCITLEMAFGVKCYTPFILRSISQVNLEILLWSQIKRDNMDYF